MESLLPEYSAFGAVREAAGSALPGIVPIERLSLPRRLDTDRRQRRQDLPAADGRDWPRDLGTAPDLATNSGRVTRVVDLDTAIAAWTQTRAIKDVLAAMEQARVPVGRVYTAKDIAEDPHYRARDMILQQQTRDGYSVEVPGIVPKLSATPGAVRSSAPHLGDDTDAVLREIGLSAAQIAALRDKNIIG